MGGVDGVLVDRALKIYTTESLPDDSAAWQSLADETKVVVRELAAVSALAEDFTENPR
jgi:hypothetical protein